MREIAELFYPAIRWDASRGHEGERPAIDQALKLGVGGFILFGGPAEHVAALTEQLHSKSHIPLLIGADLERGAGQQFVGQTALPPLAAIASLEDIQAVRRSAAVSAAEAREMGINWIYAPDCDIDVEPNNPIIGTEAIPNGWESMRQRGSMRARPRECSPAQNIFPVTGGRPPTRTRRCPASRNRRPRFARRISFRFAGRSSGESRRSCRHTSHFRRSTQAARRPRSRAKF